MRGTVVIDSQNNRHWVRPGDLLFFSGSSWVSQVIRWKTWSRYSHVAICSGHSNPELDPVIAFESTTINPDPCLFERKPTSGVQAHSVQSMIDRSMRQKDAMYLYKLRDPLNGRQDWDLEEFCLDRLGLPYDYKGAGYSGTHILKWFLPEEHSRYFCSEFCMDALHRVGRMPSKISSASVNPGNLAYLARLWSHQDPVRLA